MPAGISTWNCAAPEKLFVLLVVVVESLCAAQQLPCLNASTGGHRARCTHSRANYGYDRDTAEGFVFYEVLEARARSKVCTQKNPLGEITPEIRYKFSQKRYE